MWTRLWRGDRQVARGPSSNAGSQCLLLALSHSSRAEVFLLTGYHVYRGHDLRRRSLMYHMSCAWNASQGTVSYITMQFCGLLRFTHSIFRACNDDHGHLELSVGLAEAVGRGDHESCFGRRCPDLRWTHSHLFRKACKFLWDRARAKILRRRSGHSSLPRRGDIVWLNTSPINGIAGGDRTNTSGRTVG